MEHKSIQKQFIFCLEGSLSASEMNRIEEHLNGCSECRSLFAELEMTISLIDQEKKIESGPYFYSKIKGKIENESVSEFSKYKRLLQPALFGLILLMGINFGIWMGAKYAQTDSPVEQHAALVPLVEISQEPIEQFLLNLK